MACIREQEAMLVKVGICDDEEVQRQYLKGLVEQWALKRGEKAVCCCYSDSEAFLFAWEEDKSYDVLLLDIEMKDMNGMELAGRIRREDKDVAIVFITGYEEYIGQGYEVSALHYLLKPVAEEKLYGVLNRAMELRQKEGIRQLFETSEGWLSIVLADIWYVEAFAHYCTLHLRNCDYQVKRGISSMEKLFADYGIAFVKPHRSYLVNLKFVTSILREELIMDDGRKIPISRRNYRQVNEAFFRYFRK